MDKEFYFNGSNTLKDLIVFLNTLPEDAKVVYDYTECFDVSYDHCKNMVNIW